MDLTSLNKEYEIAKKSVQNEKNSIKRLNQNLNDYNDDKKIIESQIVQAKRRNDKAEIERLKNEIKKIDGEISNIRAKGNIILQQARFSNAMVNDKLNKIKENPAMSMHVDMVLAKQFDRRIVKLKNEKKEIAEKKNSIQNLASLLSAHPSLMNNARGIASAAKTINKLNAELNEPSITPTRANEILTVLIPNEKKRMNLNQKKINDYIAKKKLSISLDTIKELKTLDYKKHSNGNLDVLGALGKKTTEYDKEIAKFDKYITKYEIAYETIPEDARRNLESKNDIKHIIGRVSRSEEQEEQVEQGESGNNFKWYNFVKRFKAWRDRRKTPELPEGSEDIQPRATEEQINEFKSSLKENISQDYLKQRRKELLKEADRQIRQNNRENRDEEER